MDFGVGMIMDFCAEKTFEDSWNCLAESNGEYLPYIIFAECMWWLFILVVMRFGVQRIRTWWRRKQIKKQGKREYDNKWSFPPQRKN